MAYWSSESSPSRPSTPQSTCHSQISHASHISHRRQHSEYSSSLPSNSHFPPSYPTVQAHKGTRSLCTPPPLDYHQSTSASLQYGYNPSSRAHGLKSRKEQRRNSTGTVPNIQPCAKILNVELEKQKKKSPAAAALLEKIARYPLEHSDPIPYNQLLRMFQHVYGNMLEPIELIASDVLDIEDPSDVSCTATIHRFEQNDTWRVLKSRPGPRDSFYCAPQIEVTLPYLPNYKATKEVIEALIKRWPTLGRHMQPAYKFKTRTHSWKFEPGMVYESVDTENLMARPVIKIPVRDNTSSRKEERRQEAKSEESLVHYVSKKTKKDEEEGEEEDQISAAGDPASRPRSLDDIKEELQSGLNKDPCKEIVKVLLAGEFKLDPRRIAVSFSIRDVEFGDGKWYPHGSLDSTYGLVLVCNKFVKYDSEEDERQGSDSASRSSRHSDDSEQEVAEEEEDEPRREIAPTVSVVLPAERTDFATDDENVEGLKACIERIRTQVAVVSAPHSRSAFCISWMKENDEFADWIAPQVIYKPIKNRNKYMMEVVEACKGSSA